MEAELIHVEGRTDGRTDGRTNTEENRRFSCEFERA